MVEQCRAVSHEKLTFLKRKSLQQWLREVSNCTITGYRGQVHSDKGVKVIRCPEGVQKVSRVCQEGVE